MSLLEFFAAAPLLGSSVRGDDGEVASRFVGGLTDRSQEDFLLEQAGTSPKGGSMKTWILTLTLMVLGTLAACSTSSPVERHHENLPGIVYQNEVIYLSRTHDQKVVDDAILKVVVTNGSDQPIEWFRHVDDVPYHIVLEQMNLDGSFTPIPNTSIMPDEAFRRDGRVEVTIPPGASMVQLFDLLPLFEVNPYEGARVLRTRMVPEDWANPQAEFPWAYFTFKCESRWGFHNGTFGPGP